MSTIRQMIAVSCNKTNYCRARFWPDDGGCGEITIKFFMNVPDEFLNSTWITNENRSVNYSAYNIDRQTSELTNNEKGLDMIFHHKRHVKFRPECKDLRKYDIVKTMSKRKRIIESRTYKIIDLIDKDLRDFFFKEREAIFGETKGNIILEKIGKLSKQWENITSNKGLDNYKPQLISQSYYPVVNCHCKECALEKNLSISDEEIPISPF